MLTERQIQTLRAAYSTASTISIENFKRLKNTVGLLPVADIERLADSGIRFVHTAANSVLCDRGVRPESARFDHFVDLIAETLRSESKAVAS